MKLTITTNRQEVKPTTILDTLCQGFEGGSFYGLEYVLEDLFENPTEKDAVPAPPGFDWFGLDS